MEGSISMSPIQLPPAQPTASPAGLHSVRKPPMKPWRRPETPQPRVYHVDPRGFRRLVQRLTGAPKPPPPMRCQAAPPPPLYFPAVAAGGEMARGAPVLSPSLLSAYASTWLGFPTLSPGNTAALELANNAFL